MQPSSLQQRSIPHAAEHSQREERREAQHRRQRPPEPRAGLQPQRLQSLEAGGASPLWWDGPGEPRVPNDLSAADDAQKGGP